MRTQTYTQVEAIVAKYKNLASETEVAKKAMENMGYLAESGIASSDMGELYTTMYAEQLIGHVCQLRKKTRNNEKAPMAYEQEAAYYMKGLISEEEESCLVDNFAEFLDCAFQSLSTVSGFDGVFSSPQEWSSIVPVLLEDRNGKLFIPHSDNGREFAKLKHFDLIVGSDFSNAALVADALGLSITERKSDETWEHLWNDLADQSFDAVVLQADYAQTEEIDSLLQACNRVVKDGGDILLCLSKDSILSDEGISSYRQIAQERMLKEAILLPSGNVLLHLVKEPHTVCEMCDASKATWDGKIVDSDAFREMLAKANTPEAADGQFVRSFLYKDLREDILLPTYYLHFPKEGTVIGNVLQEVTDKVSSDDCNGQEKVVTVNQLSQTYSKGEFHVGNLPSVRTDRVRAYNRVEGPAVIVAVSEIEIAVAYTLDNAPYLVARNLYVLKPSASLDVRYLAAQLLSSAMQRQLVALVKTHPLMDGKGRRLTSHWAELVRIQIPTLEEQQKFVQEVMRKDFVAQEQQVAMREQGFKHSIRLRKHALSQNISAFDSLFGSVEYCMREHHGRLNAKDQLSPVSPMTVGEAMEILHSNLKTICERVAKLADEQDWGPCEAIEPQQLIEEYEQTHRNSGYKFEHLWEQFETNCFAKDFYDKNTGKLLFHKGEAMNAAWFPKRALLQVLDNIVANAREHGFTDKGRDDYVIQTSWTTDGLHMLIKVANNGKPMPADLDPNLVLEYGYSSALNQRGHGGLGGGEMAEIVRKFGGEVSVVSTPDKKFTVTYVLKLPLASLY